MELSVLPAVFETLFRVSDLAYRSYVHTDHAREDAASERRRQLDRLADECDRLRWESHYLADRLNALTGGIVEFIGSTSLTAEGRRVERQVSRTLADAP